MELPIYAHQVQNGDSEIMVSGEDPNLPLGLTFQGHV